MKAKILDIDQLRAAIKELLDYPLNYKNILRISDWYDKATEIVNNYMQESGFADKMKEYIDKLEQEIPLPARASAKKKEERAKEIAMRRDVYQNELLNEIRSKEVEIPKLAFDPNEPNIPSRVVLLFDKSEIVTILTSLDHVAE